MSRKLYALLRRTSARALGDERTRLELLRVLPQVRLDLPAVHDGLVV